MGDRKRIGGPPVFRPPPRETWPERVGDCWDIYEEAGLPVPSITATTEVLFGGATVLRGILDDLTQLRQRNRDLEREGERMAGELRQERERRERVERERDEARAALTHISVRTYSSATNLAEANAWLGDCCRVADAAQRGERHWLYRDGYLTPPSERGEEPSTPQQQGEDSVCGTCFGDRRVVTGFDAAEEICPSCYGTGRRGEVGGG